MASEVDLQALMEPVARRLLGDPNQRLSTAKILRWGTNGSLAVDLEKGAFFDNEAGHGGGVLALIEERVPCDRDGAWEWLHIEFPNETRTTNGHDPSGAQIAKAYPYVDADNVVLLEVCRKVPKGFVQRKPDGKGGYLWSTKGVKPVPYRLPELLADIAAGHTIWIPEGEKDVDRLRALGLAATTNAGGAGKWRRELNEYFQGADVIVVADNDEPGRDHARQVAQMLVGVTSRVRLLDLGAAWPSCPPKGDVSDWFDAKHTVDELLDMVEMEAPPAEAPTVSTESTESPADDLEALALEPRLITAIPPRPWAYGKYLLFGSAAVLGAADGVGKGFITTAIILSVIFGRALLGERIWKRGPVAIVTYEDDHTEWERKIAAGCLRYELDFAEAIRNIRFVQHKGAGRVVLARQLEGRTLFPDSAAMVRELGACGAVLLVVDPFNSAHDIDDGNSNVLIARVALEITRIAQASGVAALVLHHLRKGASGEVDDLMGATALRANFRATRILMRMTPEQAEELGIGVEHAFRHVRIAGTKENYAPPPDKAHWFKLESQALGNGTDDYPDGDDMAVAVLWSPPSPFEGLSLTDLGRVFEGLRAGPGEGWAYSLEARSRFPARQVLLNEGLGKAQADRVLQAWLDSDVVRSIPYTTPSRSKSTCIELNEAKVGAILAPLRPPKSEDDE